MDFQEKFLNALQSNLSLTKSISLHDYMPVPNNAPDATEGQLPSLEAWGSIQACYPYYYEISHLDSYCLLYTENGAGSLTEEEQSITLSCGTLAFIDCRKKHRIEIKQSPWQYKVFFTKGNPLSFLHASFSGNYGSVYTLAVGSSVPYMIQKFFEQVTRNVSNPFLESKFILDILLETTVEKKKSEKQTTHISDYIAKIKKSFDENYIQKFSLDSLEQEYHVSKYQLCREFTAQYGSSPIQYLNHVRITMAKEALANTDKRINEIGRMVGFENTNHFIRLFKKQTGVTPLVFRKQSPVHTFF